MQEILKNKPKIDFRQKKEDPEQYYDGFKRFLGENYNIFGLPT